MNWRRGMACLVLTIITVMITARFAAGWLDVSELRQGNTPREQTYVVALPGGTDSRTFAAAVIYREGIAGTVAILGELDSFAAEQGDQLPTWRIAELVYRSRGVPQDKILLLAGKSQSTETDIQQLATLWEHEPQAHVIIVTSAAHTRRVALTCRNLLPKAPERYSILACPEDRYAVDRWWQTETGMRVTVAENLKLAVYAARFGGWKVATLFVLIGSFVMYAARRYRSQQSHHQTASSERTTIECVS